MNLKVWGHFSQATHPLTSKLQKTAVHQTPPLTTCSDIVVSPLPNDSIDCTEASFLQETMGPLCPR